MGYLQETGQLTPKWKKKLQRVLNSGYQRLLSFEVSGGGFDWYGRGPANTRLTAYGILLLSDMDSVYPVDRRVIDRALEVLYKKQNADGSWANDAMSTAYVSWALREAGASGAGLPRAVSWLKKHTRNVRDPYVRALVALALGNRASAEALEQDAVITNGAARWKTEGVGIYHARGHAASIEASALAAMALFRQALPLGEKALTGLVRDKDASGSWHSTQSTILAMKALLEASRNGHWDLGNAIPVTLTVNRRVIKSAFAPLTRENHDVVQEVEIPVRRGDNVIELRIGGEARINYQVAGQYYVPWEVASAQTTSSLTIRTEYEKSVFTLGESALATTRLGYSGKDTFMVIAELGLPPGFLPNRSSFDALVKSGVIDKYSIGEGWVSLYFGRVRTGDQYEFTYAITPRFLVEAIAPASRVYEYYAPTNTALSTPRRIRVSK